MRCLIRNSRIISGITRLKNLKDYLTKSELEFLNKYSDGWLVRYRDAWHLIGDK